jgi:hypothetical protein
LPVVIRARFHCGSVEESIVSTNQSMPAIYLSVVLGCHSKYLKFEDKKHNILE